MFDAVRADRWTCLGGSFVSSAPRTILSYRSFILGASRVRATSLRCRDPGPGVVIIGVVLVRVTLGSRFYTGDGQSK